ncbi:hypothetical protein Y032_0008g42 [Ancylostoma ceylanicum]|uniref:C-type lectin domain-containing protein n=1 Tax=Ancylostoma ceylanicum TaxID=53326 RepID=A0A016VLN6_9BILA|nr:hypothetical protein Y032_0008g42 [Ancylostoma ceylanicum]
MAALQFQTEADRPNARNVIVLMATSYYVGGAFAPGQVAAQFKEDNGVLVVYNYVEEHGFPETELESLASPGYFLTNTEDNNGDAIRRALCDANCFCRLGYDTFGKDPLRNTPTAEFNSGSSFWIGLKWEQIKQSYEWADGSALASTAQPWASSPSPHQTGVDCVRVVPQGSNLVWAPVDCRETFTYSCEVSPCDSQTFCTQDV